MLRIVVAGDIRLYRDGVAQHLGRDPRFSVVGVADNRAALATVTREMAPEMVIIDMAMHESLVAVRDLMRDMPNASVVALTVPEQEAAVLACAEAGIAAYVLRNGSLEDLTRAIESASLGESIVSPRMAASLMRRVATLAADRAPPPMMDELTTREREIVALLAEGLSNKQIAGRLNIELATAKNHVHRILEKLHVSRRGEIAARLRRDVRASDWAALERRELHLER
jgi:DNA-binding NarL/FixJ family response regulator